MITTEQIKELRDTTGVSVMQCKKALEEAEGNIEKAIVILRKKSGEIAART
jgi:elongation factor Ts